MIGVETALLAAAADPDTMTITRRRPRRRRSHLAVEEEDLLRAAGVTPASGIIANEAVALLYPLFLLGARQWALVAAAAVAAVRTAGMMTILRLIHEAAAGVGATTERGSLQDHPGAAAAERRTVPLDAMVLPEEEAAATSPVVLAEPQTRREVPKVARKGEQVPPPLPERQPVPRRRPRRHLRSRVVRAGEA